MLDVGFQNQVGVLGQDSCNWGSTGEWRTGGRFLDFHDKEMK